MMTLMETVNISIAVTSFIISIILLIATGFGSNLRQRVHRWFFITLVCNFLVLVFEFIVGFMQGSTGPVADFTVRLGDCLTYVATGLHTISFGIYLYTYFRTKTTCSKTFLYPIAFLGTMTIVLGIIAQFNHMYAWFDASNCYRQAPGFWISQICPSLSMLIYMGVTLRHFKILTRREWISLLSYTVIPMICVVIETVYVDVWIAYFGATVAELTIYLNIQIELKRQMEAQEAELVKKRTAIMLSQIQPHFLHNSLTAISELCPENPSAQQALRAFSEYLRFNMNSLSKEQPVPFQQELEHTRQYLWLEAIRFEDRLRVVYDIRTEQFMLPVLTMQPIVENAVRHGVTKREDGGTVTIRTEETARAFVVSVIDDGAGFDPAGPLNDGRAHLGIKNVRARLDAMCGGQLIIESRVGEGTVVRIELPKEMS